MDVALLAGKALHRVAAAPAIAALIQRALLGIRGEPALGLIERGYLAEYQQPAGVRRDELCGLPRDPRDRPAGALGDGLRDVADVLGLQPAPLGLIAHARVRAPLSQLDLFG